MGGKGKEGTKVFLFTRLQVAIGLGSLVLINLIAWLALQGGGGPTPVAKFSQASFTNLATRRSYSVSPEEAVEVFRHFMLQQPPPAKVPVSIEHKDGTYYSQVGQDKAIDAILKQKRNGFFIEVGAYDGVSLSNSLFFELSRGWTGLLIEANPRAYRELLQKDRHAWTTGACISLSDHVELGVDFLAHGMVGGYQVDRFKDGGQLKRQAETNPYVYSVKANCFPLGVMLDAIGVNKVDMFSLDVEGAELAVLKTIDFDRFEISLIVVEENGNRKALVDFMMSKGYRVHSTIAGNDILFMKP
jgi:FkbM family methyltransferase